MTKQIGLDEKLFSTKEQLPETLSIRDEAELRILAVMVGGYCANNQDISLIDYEKFVMVSKQMAKVWMKARTK